MNINSPILGDRLQQIALLVEDLKNFRVDIEAALVYGGGTHSFDDVVTRIFTGALHFYPFEKSFLIAELCKFPQYNVYHVYLAGGDLEELIDAHDKIIGNARQMGCKTLTISGRHGWVRALKSHGWKHTLSHLTLEIEE